MPIEERKFSTIDEATFALAQDLWDILRKAILKRGHALLAVSGGKTPRKVFKDLRKQRLDWDCVTITLTDERWIPNDHPDSNEKLVRSCLLSYLSPNVNFIPFYGGHKTLEDDVKSCEERLKTLELPFDALYLGMGPDGHFASLFPGDTALDISASLCTGVEGTDFRLPRITLTKSAILNSRKIYLLFSGEDKYSVYHKAKVTGSYTEIPLRLILSQGKIPVIIYIVS